MKTDFERGIEAAAKGLEENGWISSSTMVNQKRQAHIYAAAIRSIKDDKTPKINLEPIAMDARGMSLRDYYAGQAMLGIRVNVHHGATQDETVRDTADAAYAQADALIARKRETEKAE